MHGKKKGYKKLLVRNRSTSGVDEIPTQDEYYNALEGNMGCNGKVVKLSDLNELAHENLILLISTSSSIGKVAFGLVWNAKNTDFLRETARSCGTG